MGPRYLKASVTGHNYRLSPHFPPQAGYKRNQTSTKLRVKEKENTAVQDHVKPVDSLGVDSPNSPTLSHLRDEGRTERSEAKGFIPKTTKSTLCSKILQNLIFDM